MRVTPHDRDLISDLTTSLRAVPERRNELNPACARTQTQRERVGKGDADVSDVKPAARAAAEVVNASQPGYLNLKGL